MNNMNKMKMLKKERETLYHGYVENKNISTFNENYTYKELLKDLYECIILGYTPIERR